MTMIEKYRRRLVAKRSTSIGILVLIILFVAGTLIVNGFSSQANIKSMLLLASFLGLAALGQTFCALLGGIDLSIAYVMGAANILLASLFNLGLPPVLSCAIVLLGGSVVGAFNGILTYRLQGQALIVTLGVGFAIVGCAQILTSIGSAYAGNVMGETPEWLSNFSSIGGTTFGVSIPPVIVCWALISALTVTLANRTWPGRMIYALGGNRTAASHLAISEFGIWATAYTISGAMAAATGMLLLGFSGGGFVDVGDPYLFTTVAAVVIGGTSLLGGRGGYGSTVIGVLVLTVLSSLLVGVGLNYPAQEAMFGFLIVPLVAFYARTPHVSMQI
jgi:ribose transport system permease protein